MSPHRGTSTSQRAMRAAGMTNLRWGGDRSKPSIDGMPQAKAGALFNVSAKSVERAKQVHARGVPELIQAVEDGRLAVSAAAALAGLPHDQQRAILARAEQARRAGGRTGRRKLQPGRQTSTPAQAQRRVAGSPADLDRSRWRIIRKALDRLANSPIAVERLVQLTPTYRVARTAANARTAIPLLAALANQLDERAALVAPKPIMPEVGG